MNKKEIFDFLKENLSVQVDWNESRREIKVQLCLNNPDLPETDPPEIISSSCEWIENSKTN